MKNEFPKNEVNCPKCGEKVKIVINEQLNTKKLICTNCEHEFPLQSITDNNIKKLIPDVINFINEIPKPKS